MALEEWQRHERAGRIKQLREESPFTQEALAERIGVKLRTYQKWEEGGGITWEHLESLAELHDVDVQWIHKGEAKGPPPDFTDRLSRLEEKVDRVLERLDSEHRALGAKSKSPARPDRSKVRPPA